ncbi:MAG: hypothetical protein KDD82_10080 [Planctomycetes bacterium]|nr:hypothetical protein [Planctomycetota bacterium]
MRRNAWWAGALVLGVVGCSSDGTQHAYRPVGTGGQVISGGALLEGRDGHAVARVDSGQLLVVGGATARAAASDTLERYDPSTGWSDPLRARLSTPRVGHQAIGLPDGRVWIVGGADARGKLLDTTELFDPTRDALQPGPRLGHPRAFAAAAVTSAGLLLAGGTSPSAELWNLTTLRPSGAPFALPGQAPLRGSLAPADGAWILAGARDAHGEALPPVWIDLATRRAELAAERLVLAGPPVAPSGASHAFLVSGRLDRPSAAFQWLERGRQDVVFDDGYRVLEPRDFPSVVAQPGGVLVVGGASPYGAPTPLASVEWVTPEGSNSVSPLAIPRRDAVLTPLPDGRVVISGGTDSGGRPVSGIEVFVPETSAASLDRYGAASRRAAQTAQQQRDLARAQAEVARLRQELDRTQRKLVQTQQQLAQAQADLTTRDAQVQGLGAQVAQLTQQLSSAQQRAQAAGGQSQSLQAQVNDLAFRLQQSKLAYDQAIRERDAARTQVFALQADLRAAQAQIQALKAQLAAPFKVDPVTGRRL